MRIHRSHITSFFCIIAMITLILDSKTALIGAAEGIDLCVRTVIPSILPMMVLSSLLIDRINVSNRLHLLNTHLGIPAGCEGIPLAGAFGGYPVGAACIAQQYKTGKLNRLDAEHLLRFCNNAGPSFIFGICGHYFSSIRALWLLWAIHIVSAITTGLCHSYKPSSKSIKLKSNVRNVTEVLKSSVSNLALICGWILLFRVFIKFCQKWFMWFFNPIIGVMVSGFLELTNGCFALNQIANEQIRFILCSVFLSFGGVCVYFQTTAMTVSLDTICYLKGKVLQTIFSFILSSVVGAFIFSGANVSHTTTVSLFITLVSPLIVVFFKKMIAFFTAMRYNTDMYSERGNGHAIS